MQQTFTHDYMEANCGCYLQDELMQCSFMSSEPVTLESILKSEISLKDKYWFVCKKLATKQQNQRIAIAVAEIVLPIYEKRYPDNRAPREAIEAAKEYIAGHISLETLREKRAAAYAAADAADDDDAAVAAYAAADAAAAAAAAYAAAASSAYASAAVDARTKARARQSEIIKSILKV